MSKIPQSTSEGQPQRPHTWPPYCEPVYDPDAWRYSARRGRIPFGRAALFVGALVAIRFLAPILMVAFEAIAEVAAHAL